MQRKLTGQCPTVTWCQEGRQPHSRHLQVVWIGQGVSVANGNDAQHGMHAEFIVHGSGEHDARPALTLIDALSSRQWNIELTWDEIWPLAGEITEARLRFGERIL